MAEVCEASVCSWCHTALAFRPSPVPEVFPPPFFIPTCSGEQGKEEDWGDFL